MTPDQQRKFNTTFGGIFIGAGVLAWLLTFYFAIVPNPPAPAPVSVVPLVDLPSCQRALFELGYEATIKTYDIAAFEPLTASPKDQLEKASLAALACKLKLQSFCMGDGCTRPGVSFVLRKEIELKRDAPAPPPALPSSAPAATPGAPKK